MRTESEMMERILSVAKQDDRVRAVYMNGSRTNPNAPKDLLQDYDIVYVVEETASFIREPKWIECFGDILFMQYPDEHPDYPSDKENSYGYLMIFTDGNRLDLTVMSIAHAQENVFEDRLCVILLDKDGILPKIPETSDETHRVQKPSERQFAACCNEFWWCLNNIAKGLWRSEPTYVQDMLNTVVRPELKKMLSWKVGVMTDYSVSVGKSGKYLHRWLSPEEWQAYLNTYCGTANKAMWKSVDILCNLFSQTAKWVAEQSGFPYNAQEEEGSRTYLNVLRTLPKSATDICMDGASAVADVPQNSDMTVYCDDGLINIRVGAIILKDGKFLMVGNEHADYLYSVGGRVKFGETAQEAIVREVWEETGYRMEVDRLGFVHENYFYGDSSANRDRLIYEISFFFYMKVPEGFEPVRSDFTDDGNLEHSRWVTAEEDITMYPEFFRTELTHPEHVVKHFVTDQRKTK